jgi:diphthine-ammonia ligase
MEIPLLTYDTLGEKEIELEDLKKAIEKAKNEFAIEGVVTGALKSEYQASRIQKICDELELECINPLWDMDQEEEIREVIKLGFKFIITKVAAYGLDKSWLGRVITNEDVDKLMEINKKIGINVAFEGGEAETLMIDGPIFKSKLEIKKAKTIMENEFTGIYNIEEVEVVEKDL